MKLFSLVSALLFACLFAHLAHADPGPMILFSGSAAALSGSSTATSTDAYPIGNGKLAAMIYGGVNVEQIQFNEDTIWAGQPHDYSHAGAASHLATMRQYILAYDETNFWNVASPYFMSTPLTQCAYQPAGDLKLTFPYTTGTNYQRSLNLDTATASVQYTNSGITYYRDVFANAPDKVIVVRLTASQAGKLTFSYAFSTQHSTKTISTSGTDLVLHASVATAANGLASSVQFESRVRIINEGGTVAVSNNTVQVTSADAVTLLLSVASNVANYHDVTANPSQIVLGNITAAAAKSYSTLRQAQLDDYQPLFRRVVLDLGTTSSTNNSTVTRLAALKAGTDDFQLIALNFQMGRYLMIAGSRPGSQPLNLQGKWNNSLGPPWDSKMTLNINEEMNYWAAEVVNLPECHEPLFDMISDLSVTGSTAAQVEYNCGGWMVHHNTDLWRGAAPINGKDGIWPTGAAWLCQHLWWHYDYGGDLNFLANKAYPLMKSASKFFVDFLSKDTRTGYMVTNPSYSPEHAMVRNGVDVDNVAGPTMDNQLIRELFNDTMKASQVLGVDADFRATLSSLVAQLPPNKIGRLGQLQEWQDDLDANGETHRHMSHLFGLFPGDEISITYTPALAAAAKVALSWRDNDPTFKNTATDWSRTWAACLHNRLLEGDTAYSYLSYTVGNKLGNNMTLMNKNTQIDGVFGVLMGTAEMFLQSHSGEVFLLPALPAKLAAGSVTGLRARGGFGVDIQWAGNKLTTATITSKLGNTCRVRSKWPVNVKLGTANVDATMILPGLYQFATVTGSSYTITAATVSETESLAAATSAGDTNSVVTNSTFSGGSGTLFNANAAGDFVTYTMPGVTAGNYHVYVIAESGTNRGQFQLSCGLAGGALANVGGVQDTYTSATALKVFDCGTWQAASDGTYQFKLSVAGKNASSSGYALSFDYIKLTPIPSALAPIDQWRQTKFGANASDESIAGDNADPDGDGLPNVLEYTLGRDPLIAEKTPAVTVEKQSGYLTLVFQRAKAATDVSLIVEAAGDLQGPWTTNVQPALVTDDGNGLTETVRVKDSVLMSDAPCRFLHLRADR